MLEIGPDDLAACAAAAQALARDVKDKLGADGVNLLNACGREAWQTVFHFHIHVIPRYVGDPLRLPWVPGPGDSSSSTKPAKGCVAAMRRASFAPSSITRTSLGAER